MAQEHWTIVPGKHGALASAALALVQRPGIAPAEWTPTMAKAGSMPGSAVGGPETRPRWAESRKLTWSTHKSGLWK
jgi:hypothetical protein